MTQIFDRCARTAGRAVLLAAFAGLAASTASAQTDVHWLTAQSGAWTDGARWTGGVSPNNGVPPGSLYRVLLDAMGSNYTVTSAGNVTVSELRLGSANARLDLTGGNFTVPVVNLQSGSLALVGGSLIGSTINVTGGSLLSGSLASVLDGVTVNGSASLGSVTLRNGFSTSGIVEFGKDVNLSGSQTLNGSFAFRSSPHRYMRTETDQTTTLGVGSALRGGWLVVGAEGGDDRRGHIVNNGLVSADQASSGPIGLYVQSFTNNGTLQAINGGSLIVHNLTGNANGVAATGANSRVLLSGSYDINLPVAVASGGSLTLEGVWTNTGGITATTGSRVVLGGPELSAASLANITRTGGSKLAIAGGYDNAGQTLTVNAAMPNVELAGGTVFGGTLATADGQALAVVGTGTLNGVANTGAVTVAGPSNNLNLEGAWSNAGGTIQLTGSGADLNLKGTFSTAGIGNIQAGLGDVFLSGTMDNAGQTFTVDASRARWWYNGGTISGGTVHLGTGGVVNTQGAGLNLADVRLTGVGTLLSANVTTSNLVNDSNLTLESSGGTLTLNGDWSNTGAINLNNGSVRLGGSFAFADLANFHVVNGTMVITGQLDNTGESMSSARFGQFRLDGGTITGGTLTGTNSLERLKVWNNASSRLHGVTVDGRLVADDATSQVDTTLFLSGGTTVSGVVDSAVTVLDIDATSAVNNTIALRNGGSLNLHGTRTLNHAVQVQSHHPSYPVNTLGMDAGGTLTIGAAGSIIGGESLLGVKLGTTGATTIVNNGTIAANVNGGVMSIEADQFINNGVLEAIGDGRLAARNLSGNLNTARIVNGTGAASLSLDGVYTINTLLATSGGTLNLNGEWTNTAGIAATNTTVNLGGMFTPAEIGAITRGGTTKVNVSGVLDNTGHTLVLDAAAGFMGLNGGTIQGGTVTTGNGFSLEQRSGSSLLTGVTVNGDVAVQAGVLTGDAGTAFNGEVSIASGAVMQFPSGTNVGGGSFTFGAAAGNGALRAVPEAGGTFLTLGSGVVVHGGNGLVGEAGTAITNLGLISADVSGKSISVQGATFANQGTVEAINGGLLSLNGLVGNLGTARVMGAGSSLTAAGTYAINTPVEVTGGTLSLNGAWTNSAGIVADNGVINLGGAFTMAAIGPMTTSGTTQINITGALNNALATLLVDSPARSWGLAGGATTGGTIATSNGQQFTQRSGSSSLTGVSVTGDLLVSGGTVSSSATTTFGGVITIGAGTLLAGTGSLINAPEVLFNGATAGLLRTTGTLTLGAGTLVHGGGGRLGFDPDETVVNQGVIRADVPGQVLTVGARINNNGTVEAVNGGTLRLSSVGTVGQASVAGAGSAMELAGNYTNTSTINVTDGGRLVFGGQWANNGLVNLVNGTLDLSGGQGPNVFNNISNSGGAVRITDRIDARGTTVTIPAGMNLEARAALWSHTLVLPTSETITLNPSGFIGQRFLQGNGHVRLLGGAVTNEQATGSSSNPFTIASAVTISGYGGVSGSPLTNQGTILANVPGQTMSVAGTTFTNQGLLEASNGGALNLSGAWTNSGTIRTRDTSTLDLLGNYTFAGGTIEALDTSTIRLGGSLNNTGSTLTATGNILLRSGLTITGGTINALSTPLRMDPAGAGASVSLRGVTLNGELALDGGSSNYSRSVSFRDGLGGAGLIHMTGNATTVSFENTQTVNGVTLFSDAVGTASPRRLGVGGANVVLTLGPTATIRGGSLNLFDPATGNTTTSTLINNGVIRADVSGQTIAVMPGAMTNHGVLEAVNGGTLYIGNMGTPTSPWSNSSTGVVRAASGGTLRLGGIATLPNGFQNSGGTVELWGRLVNTGRTLTLSGGDSSMSMREGARIFGGIVDNTGGGLSIPNATGNGFLDGVTVIGDVTVGGVLSMVNGAEVTGTVRLLDGSEFYLGAVNSPTPWVLDNDTIEFAQTPGAPGVPLLRMACDNLVIGADSLIHGGGGFLFRQPGSNVFVAPINHGRISADRAGQILQVSSLDNYGTLEAVNGGILYVAGTYRPSTVLRQINSTLNITNASTALINSMERVGGTINFQGTLENTGNTFTLDPTTNWGLAAASRIKGGTLNIPVGVNLSIGYDTTFDNIAVNGDLRITEADQINIRAGMTLNGLIDLYRPNSKVIFVGDQTFASGTIFFNPDGGAGERQVTLRGPGFNGQGFANVLIGAGATIRGGDGKLRLGWGAGSLGTLTNQGLISADITGKQLAIEQQRFVNFGTVQAINGGIIAYQGPTAAIEPAEFVNAGLLMAGPGGQLFFDRLLLEPEGAVMFSLGGGGLGSILATEVSFAGTLTLEVESPFSLVNGTSLPLFTFDSAIGEFSSIVLPQLGAELAWDTSQLYVDGTVHVVPSPAGVGLLSLGLLGAARRRRKS